MKAKLFAELQQAVCEVAAYRRGVIEIARRSVETARATDKLLAEANKQVEYSPSSLPFILKLIHDPDFVARIAKENK